MTVDNPSTAEGTNALWVRLIGLTRSVIALWALTGGALLSGLVLLTAYSAVMNLLFRTPVPGDFELVELGVAMAIATFLPYCQLNYANVTVDIFTTRAGPRTVAALSLLASVIAFCFALLLLWRMSLGFADLRQYQEYTAVIGIPIWTAFPAFLVSLFLLAVAALITAGESIGRIRTGRTDAPAAQAH